MHAFLIALEHRNRIWKYMGLAHEGHHALRVAITHARRPHCVEIVRGVVGEEGIESRAIFSDPGKFDTGLGRTASCGDPKTGQNAGCLLARTICKQSGEYVVSVLSEDCCYFFR